jgi:hypothetical protein
VPTERSLRWEYEIDHVRTQNTGPDSVPLLAETLRHRGSDGWELVSALPSDQEVVLLIFKKRLSGNAP